MKASGSAFEKALYAGYLNVAKSEHSESDFFSDSEFADRAIATASGKAPAPEAIKMRKLPKTAVGELSSARERLMSVFGAGAREKWPSPAANAQVMFDCWMEEQEENIQPEDIAKCRAGFFAAMAQIDKAMMAMPAAKKPAKKAEAMPMAALPGPFIVYFGFDSAAINGKNAAIVRDAAAAAKNGKAKEIVLQGHADRSGSSAYNTGLSQRRVDAVAAALGRAGVKSGIIGKAQFGEQQPTVATPNGQREGRNRRVEIYLSR